MNKLVRISGLGGDMLFPSICGTDVFESFFADNDFGQLFGNQQIVPYDAIAHKDKQGNVVSLEIQYALAGYDNANVKVEVDGDILKIVADKSEETGEEDESKTYLYKGISHRRIEASYNISGYKKDDIIAAFCNGILKVTLPVEPKVAAKRIAVKVKDQLPAAKSNKKIEKSEIQETQSSGSSEGSDQ